MDTNIAHKIARAFVHGLAFAKGMTTLAQDAKAKMEEGDKWITIGAEPGDDGKKHGGRHVLISGTGEVKKGLSKSAQGKPLGEAIKELKDKAESKKAESKPAQQRTESWREMAIRHKQEVAARANRSQEDIEAAHQLFLKFDRGAMRTMMEVSEVTFPAQQRMRDVIRGEIPGANVDAEKSIKDSLSQIRSNIGTFDKTMGKIQSRIAKAISDGKIGEGRVDAELRDYRRYYDTFADYIARANKQMNNLDHTVNDGHQEDREVLSKIAGLTSELAEDAARWNNKLENANTPETHTYSAKELDSMKQKKEGRSKAKKQNAELNRKLKEGEKAGNIQFPRNEFRERAKVYTEQANQVINDDLKPSVDKLGSTIRKDTDNARMPQSTLDDLNDIHNLAKQIGPMANKLNKYNEKYAAEHDDPSNYVISNYGAATKGTAERAASLTRRAAAMSNQLTAPDDERDYSEGRAKQEIRDILVEMRGLHGDLLKKTRHAATAFNTESTPAQGAQTKERTGTSTREPSVSREVPKSFDLSTKEIKDLTDKIRDYTDDRTGSYEFGRKLQDMANLSAEIDKMDKMDKRYLSSMAQHNLEAARHHLGLAAKAARAVDNYQWRGAISSLRTEITRRLNTANRLYQEALTESDRVDAMYAQKGSKPKQRIIN